MGVVRIHGFHGFCTDAFAEGRDPRIANASLPDEGSCIASRSVEPHGKKLLRWNFFGESVEHTTTFDKLIQGSLQRFFSTKLQQEGGCRRCALSCSGVSSMAPVFGFVLAGATRALHWITKVLAAIRVAVAVTLFCDIAFLSEQNSSPVVILYRSVHVVLAAPVKFARFTI